MLLDAKKLHEITAYRKTSNKVRGHYRNFPFLGAAEMIRGQRSLEGGHY